MDKTCHPKWEWKISTRLTHATADQIWPLLKDFFGLNKWFPGLPTSYGVQGTNGEVGCIRYCGGNQLSSDGGVSWSKERLTAVDPAERLIRYEIVDCNIGFKSYVSTVRIVPGGDEDGGGGCAMEWSVTVDQVEGWRLEDLVKKYEAGLQGMAKNMEDGALRIASSTV